MVEDERSEALIKEWKQALFDDNGPGGKIEMDELETILGASAIVSCCRSRCPNCTANC